MTKKPIQIFFVHGAPTLRTRKQYLEYIATKGISLNTMKRWHGEYLIKHLGPGFKVIKPQMPNPDNGIYKDRKLYFERFIPLLDKEVILIGNSLGGIFLAKYLSENAFPKKIIALYLVAAPFDNHLAKNSKFGIAEQELVGGFTLGANLTKLEKSTKNIHLLFSTDDEVVAPLHGEKYKKKLPHADLKLFSNVKGHFRTEKFPEIVKMIKDDIKKTGVR